MLTVIFAAVPKSSQLLHVLHKTGHPVAFALLAWIFLVLLERPSEPRHGDAWQRYFLAFFLALAAGVATELAQLLVHRGASQFDVLRDCLGAFAILMLHAGASRQRVAARVRRRSALLATGAIAAATALFPLAWCGAAYVNRELRFPVLWQNATPLDAYFIDTKQYPLVLGTYAVKTGSFIINEPHPDWSQYSQLVVEVNNPTDLDMLIIVRVHDQDHDWTHDDRLNRRVPLSAQSNARFTIDLQEVRHAPNGRLLDLTRVAGVAVFTAAESKPYKFLLNRVWLSK